MLLSRDQLNVIRWRLTLFSGSAADDKCSKFDVRTRDGWPNRRTQKRIRTLSALTWPRNIFELVTNAEQFIFTCFRCRIFLFFRSFSIDRIIKKTTGKKMNQIFSLIDNDWDISSSPEWIAIVGNIYFSTKIQFSIFNHEIICDDANQMSRKIAYVCG